MSVKRVLVVDDSIFMRRIISDLIAELPGFQVIATAKNGVEAVDMAKKLQPDCITMDVEMPEMNGLEALKRIMKDAPTPVIMLSSLTREGAMETVQALESGAVDFVQKPSGSISLDLFKVKAALHEKLEIAVRSKVRRLDKPLLPAAPPPQASEAPPVRKNAPPKSISFKPDVTLPPPWRKTTSTETSGGAIEHLVAIGTSTGGPRALQQVLTRLPEGFPAPIVIVQHMPPNFTNSLALRLDANCRIKVVEGTEGAVLQAGTAYIAPGGFHMRVQREQGSYRLRVSSEEPRGGHRPSVDMLFESIISCTELKRHIVIMTGMGSDGAKGMLALKKNGAVTTIAESEETCVVYGMPRAAVELGGVDHLLPVHEIANKLIQTLVK